MRLRSVRRWDVWPYVWFFVVRLRSVRRRDVWPYVGFFIVRLRSVRRIDVWPYVGFFVVRLKTMGNFTSIQEISVKKLFPVIFAVDGNRAGMMLRMSCARQDASRDRIWVAGFLTNDGRGCGSREIFQSLLGSREYWVTNN